jgi:hypothetical protein
LADLSIDRDQRGKSKTGSLEQLPESKTQISHHMNDRMKMRQAVRLDSNYKTPLTRFFVCGLVLWRTASLLLRRLLSVGGEIRRVFKEPNLLLRFSWNLRRVCRFAQSDFRYLLIARVCFPFDAITRDVAKFLVVVDQHTPTTKGQSGNPGRTRTGKRISDETLGRAKQSNKEVRNMNGKHRRVAFVFPDQRGAHNVWMAGLEKANQMTL